MKTVQYIIMFALASVFGQAWAVNVGLTQDGIDEVFFEREMEDRLTRDISAYLGHNRFIIGVDFQLSGSQAPGGEDNVVVREITTPLPGLPKANETFTKELTTEELNNLRENLLLDNQVGSRGSILGGQTGNIFTGSGSVVYLVLDTTVNSIQEAFIRGLIERKLSLDAAGGDSIQVVRSTFSTPATTPQPESVQQPQQGGFTPEQFFPQQFPQQAPQPAPVVPPIEQQPLDPGVVTEEVVGLLPPQEEIALEAQPSFVEENLGLLSVIGILALLLLFLLVFLLMRRSPSYPTPVPVYPPAPAVAEASAKESAVDDEARLVRNSISEIRREIAAIGLASPETSRSEMESLFAQGRTDIIAPVYKVLGEDVFESLFGSISPGQRGEITDFLVDRDVTDTQLEAQSKEFYSRLVRNASENTQANRSQAFKFLDKLHLSQILFLIKGEKTRIQALIVSQLQSKSASEVLQSLEAQQRSQIIHELAQFETFPVETFRDVATLLAKKSRKLPVIENVQTDGIGILMNLLDNMNTVEEGRILSDLQTKDPELYQKVRSQYFTFDDMAKAPQKVMGEALLDVDKSVLAASLTGANDNIIRRVLGSMPKRLADAVKDEMNVLKGKLDDEQIQGGRKALVRRMRELVREGKIDMEKI